MDTRCVLVTLLHLSSDIISWGTSAGQHYVTNVCQVILCSSWLHKTAWRIIENCRFVPDNHISVSFSYVDSRNPHRLLDIYSLRISQFRPRFWTLSFSYGCRHKYTETTFIHITIISIQTEFCSIMSFYTSITNKFQVGRVYLSVIIS
jgi:hypothetical protein